MVSASFLPEKEAYTFEEVADIIKESLHAQLNKAHLEDLFSYSVSNQMNKLMRPVPPFSEKSGYAHGLYKVGGGKHDHHNQYRKHQD